MSNFMAYAENPLRPTDRRRYVRKPVGTLAYVELDEGNGGIVLNVSEGGLSVQAVTSLMDDRLPRVRFQLTQSPNWIETGAQVRWATESRKLAGLEFIDVSERARGEIRRWLAGELPQEEDRKEEKGGSDFPVVQENETATVAAASAIRTDTASVALDAEPHSAAIPAPTPVATDQQGPVGFGLGPVVTEQPASETVPPTFGYSSRYASPPGQARDFKLGMIGEALSSTADEPKGHDIRTLLALIGFLAFVSLAAGWAAGHGTVNKFVEKIRSMSAARSVQETPTTPASPAVRVSEIEVVNLNNQLWTIPFDSPSNASQQSAPFAVPANGSREFSKPVAGFNTWVLSPPVRPAATANETAAQPEAPPAAVPDVPSAPENGPASPLVANSIALESVVPKPEVRQSAGIVKRGDLVHRVEPIYPVLAREQRMEGTVRLTAHLAEDGSVRRVTVLGGPPLLLQAAADAVKQWRYAPTTLDGRPIETERDVSLVFHL